MKIQNFVHRLQQRFLVEPVFGFSFIAAAIATIDVEIFIEEKSGPGGVEIELKTANVDAVHAGDADTDPGDAFLAAIRRGDVNADELISKYYAIVYVESGTYQEAGRRLGVDWRTVKSKVSEDYLRELVDTSERSPTNLQSVPVRD